MDKTIIKGANVSNVKEGLPDTYTFYSRLDGYFAVLKNNEDETTYEWYVGYDSAVGDSVATPNYDAVYADPTSVTYAIPAKMAKDLKRLVMNANRGWDQLSRRNFE